MFSIIWLEIQISNVRLNYSLTASTRKGPGFCAELKNLLCSCQLSGSLQKIFLIIYKQNSKSQFSIRNRIKISLEVNLSKLGTL